MNKQKEGKKEEILLVCLRISKICSNFAAQNCKTTQNLTYMAQETLNGLLQYLLATLSYDNRAWLSQHLIEPQASDALAPYTMEEINARLDESEQQITAGEFYTTEEVLTDLKRLIA